VVEPSEKVQSRIRDSDKDRIDDDKVVVVAAANAWPFYQMTGAYVCQEDRTFQEDSGRFGFYTARLIQGAAPKIEWIFPSMEVNDDYAAWCALHTDPLWRRAGEVLNACMDYGWSDDAVEVVLLTPMDSPETARFQPVRHEGKSAWTMRQRYTLLSSLREARTTDDLVIVGRDR
jgi:hypothetical protein